ncbi:hypothetical protein GCM10022215_04790 [Nocardioides fonticola]|uniref:DNA modification methylase n=1 Tax=Nocardioides fonticola TaxID=450363 RepID=A0ABP7XB10_9ACTN
MPHRRPLRRSAALAVAALAIVPTLSSCGFHYATDRVYTPAAGINDRSGEVDILGAVVVSSRPGEGTLVASLSNGSATEAISLQGVNPSAEEDVTVAQFSPIAVGARKNADLAEDAIAVTGNYGAGDVLTLSFVFSDGETVTTDVAVVTACDEFAGYDTAFADASPSAEPTGKGEDKGTGEEASPSAEPTGEPYDCSFPTGGGLPHSE